MSDVRFFLYKHSLDSVSVSRKDGVVSQQITYAILFSIKAVAQA